jgi:DNA primase
VVLCFDSDAAGQNAAVRALDSLLASGLAIRVATVPAPHDPDSFIKANGGPAFKHLIERAEGFFDYYLGRLCATNEITTDKGRLAVLRSMAEAVHKTGNVVLIDTYAQKTALRLGVAPEAVRAEFKKLRRNLKEAPASLDEVSTANGQTIRPSRDEFGLLQLIFQHEDLVEFASAHLLPDWIQHPAVRRIISERFNAISDDHWHGVPHLLELLNDSDCQTLLTEAVAGNYMEVPDHRRGRSVPNPLEDLRGIITRLRNSEITSEIARLDVQLATLEVGTPQQVETLRKKDSLQSLRSKPITRLTTSLNAQNSAL